MIKIEIGNIEQVKNEYFDGVQQLILPRINFYLTAFKVINGSSGYNISSIQNYPGIPTVTKTSFLKILGRRKKSFSRQAHYKRLRNRKSLSVHFYNHRINYINLLTTLSTPLSLKALILAEVDDLLTQESLFSQHWITSEGLSLINEIFCYDDFIKKDTLPYNAYNLASALNVNVCPYCNRVYTNTIISSARLFIIRPTFDHFFHKAVHPFLALSFYNLIPSCNYCNSSLKGQKAFTLINNIHPYKEGFGSDATFDYLQTALHGDKGDARNYKVIIKDNTLPLASKTKRIFGISSEPDSGNAKVFRLEEVYQGHADVVGELIVKSDRLSLYHAESVLKLLTHLGATKREFYRFYFSNYFDEADFNKRPLAKLTKDIISKYIPELI